MIPTLLLLAGPNGSGKSTLASTRQFAEMTAGLGAAAALVVQRKSMIIETTLSGNNHFRTVEICKRAGYYLALHYVFVSSIDLAVARVRLRVELGGHDVPREDQTRRYGRSLRNTEQLIPHCYEAFVYNNDAIEPFVLLAEYFKGRLVYLDDETAISRSNARPSWLPLDGNLCPACSSYGLFEGIGPYRCSHCGTHFTQPKTIKSLI